MQIITPDKSKPVVAELVFQDRGYSCLVPSFYRPDPRLDNFRVYTRGEVAVYTISPPVDISENWCDPEDLYGFYIGAQHDSQQKFPDSSPAINFGDYAAFLSWCYLPTTRVIETVSWDVDHFHFSRARERQGWIRFSYALACMKEKVPYGELPYDGDTESLLQRYWFSPPTNTSPYTASIVI